MCVTLRDFLGREGEISLLLVCPPRHRFDDGGLECHLGSQDRLLRMTKQQVKRSLCPWPCGAAVPDLHCFLPVNTYVKERRKLPSCFKPGLDHLGPGYRLCNFSTCISIDVKQIAGLKDMLI